MGAEAMPVKARARASGRFRAQRSRVSARFALAGLALAFAIALVGPALARWLPMTAEIATFLSAAIVLVALGVYLGRSVDSLERRTLEDPMTCVGNRRHWEQSLELEVDRALRSHMPLSVLMVDLDNLKSLNDAHGHGCGDRALALVGEVLRDTCRSRDVASRFGGDEFTLLLPRTRSSEAKVVAERIRVELGLRRAALDLPQDVTVSVSIGIAELDRIPIAARRTAATCASALFESADRALYAAKSAGRDRIEVFEPPRVSGVIRLDEHRVRKGSAAAK
jgi:diguanylate cyclase (GGDEF)-like protein